MEIAEGLLTSDLHKLNVTVLAQYVVAHDVRGSFFQSELLFTGEGCSARLLRVYISHSILF